jgi:SulP family sulfate permease
LLCGAVGSNMTGVRLQANQELIAQGIGNMLIPFFGGVPATAAIARTSVGIKSGGQTRLVSIIHAVGLLLSMFLLAPFMARIPLAALAGVLMVTAVRMNEWERDSVHLRQTLQDRHDRLHHHHARHHRPRPDASHPDRFLPRGRGLPQQDRQHRHRRSGSGYGNALKQKGIETAGKCQHVRVAFLTGPLFFAATGQFNEAFQNLKDTHALILSMRGVSLVDTAGHRSHSPPV